MGMQGPTGVLRPLPASVRIPRLTVGTTSLHQLAAENAMKATLAEDNFLGRPYTTSGIPALGRGLDGAMRNCGALQGDLRTLTQARLRPNLRVAVGSKVVADVDCVAFYGEMTANAVRQAEHRAVPTPPACVTGIHRAGAIGNLVLARVTLPSLAVATITKTAEALRLSRDTGTTKSQRQVAWRDAAYAHVAMYSMGAGVTGAISTLAAGHLGSPLTRTARVLASTDAFYVVDKISKVLAPVADGALLFADVMQLQQQLHDPATTKAHQARAWFNVGLGAVKVVADCCPRSSAATTAYSVVGVVQLGLAGFDQIQASRHRRKCA